MSTGRTTSTKASSMTTLTRPPTPRVTRIVVTPRVAQRLSPELSPYIIAPSTTPRTESGFLRATRLSLGTPVLNNLRNSILAVVIQFTRGETNQSSPQYGATNASPSEAPTTAALMLTLQLTTSVIMMLQKETAVEHVSAVDPEANKSLMASDSDDDIIKALQGMSLEPPKSTIQTPSVVKKYIVYKNSPT
uniref:Polyprotein protein n=1 Tax=Panagrellus redivivus TaxID=6233 RepID=A0A7E4W4C4_PANRE